MENSHTNRTILLHNEVTSLYYTVAVAASFREKHPVGGILLNDPTRARSAIRKTVAAILGRDDICLADIRLSDMPEFKEFCKNAPLNVLAGRLRSVLFTETEEITPLFYHDVKMVSSWNSLINEAQSQFVKYLAVISAKKVKEIGRRREAFSLERFNLDRRATHLLDSLDREVVEVGSLILNHGTQLILENIDVFIAAAEASLPVGFWHDEVKKIVMNDFSKIRFDGTGTRLLELAPGPMTLITGPHFEKIRSMLPQVDCVAEYHSPDFLKNLKFNAIVMFLSEHYRGATSALSDDQFNDWCMYAINCATERFIFAVG